jgi:hypothetical protein
LIQVAAQILTLWLIGSSCFASSVEFTSGNAVVNFSLVGNSTIQVTLTNNSLMTATSPSDVLTGVYFSTGQPLTPMNAYVDNVRSFVNCPDCTNAMTDIGAEWAYRNGVGTVLPGESVSLLGAADFGIFELGDRFSKNNIAGTEGVGGIDFGIVGTPGSSGQAALTGSPLIGQRAIFVFDSPYGYDLNSIGNVGFLYGQNYFGGGYYGTLVVADSPEPGTWLLMGIGVGVLAWRRRTRRA